MGSMHDSTSATSERLAAALAPRYSIERFLREIRTTTALHHPPGGRPLR
jgi:hypothetical protein